MVSAPDPFRCIGAWKNSTEAHKRARPEGLDQRSKMEEVMLYNVPPPLSGCVISPIHDEARNSKTAEILYDEPTWWTNQRGQRMLRRRRWIEMTWQLPVGNQRGSQPSSCLPYSPEHKYGDFV